MSEDRVECTIHCWSSTNPNKQCPACVDTTTELAQLRPENFHLRKENDQLRATNVRLAWALELVMDEVPPITHTVNGTPQTQVLSLKALQAANDAVSFSRTPYEDLACIREAIKTIAGCNSYGGCRDALAALKERFGESK